MAKAYTGRVAWVTNDETGEQKYVAVPEADWAPKEDAPHESDPHPDASLTAEELWDLPEVEWIPEPDKLETVKLAAETVPGSVHPSGKDYTFEERETQKGGGHFELKG